MKSERTQRLFFACSMVLVFLFAAFWTAFNFLPAEDSFVLFNRSNHLEGAPVFFYYAGYMSLFPQFFSYIFSFFGQIYQPILFSALSAVVFCVFLWQLFSIVRSGFILVFIVVVCGVFYPSGIYSLTSTLWSGLVILGLVGLRSEIERKSNITWRQAIICIPGLLGSPLAVVFFPLYAWIFYRTRSLTAFFIGCGTILSYVVLIDHGGYRVDSLSLIDTFSHNVMAMFQTPMALLSDLSAFRRFTMSALGLLSFLVIAVLGLNVARKTQGGGVAILLYLAGSLSVTVIAFVTSLHPMEARYWFPTVVCGLVVAGLFLRGSDQPRYVQQGQYIVVLVLIVGVVLSSTLRMQKWGGRSSVANEWKILAENDTRNGAILRRWHSSGGIQWSIGVGRYALSFSDCAERYEHPASVERFDFRIYCGPRGSKIVE